HLLIEYIGIKKRDLGSPPADVVPGFVIVEDADARRCSQQLYHLILGGGAGMDLLHLIRGGQVAALLDGWRTASEAADPRQHGDNERPMRDGDQSATNHET